MKQQDIYGQNGQNGPEPEYKTFKDWLKLMNNNNYITLFVIGLAFFIGILSQYEKFTPVIGFYIVIAIPTLMMIIIAYKGFYKHWKEMQNKKSS